MTVENILRCTEGVEEIWYAMDQDGRFCEPGTPGALRYQPDGEGIRITSNSDTSGIGNCSFTDIKVPEGIPAEAVLWGLCPYPGLTEKWVGWRWISTDGETVPLTGGAYGALDHAGIMFAGITKKRCEPYTLGGLRTVYINPQ